MKKVISCILKKYSQLINTYYDEDDFNIPIFTNLLKLEKGKIKNLGIQKSIKEINKRLNILIGYVSFLQKKYMEKLPYSKNVVNKLIKYIRKGGDKHLFFSGLNQKETEKLIETLLIIGLLTEVIDRITIIQKGYINELEKFFKEKIFDKKERIMRQKQISKSDALHHFSYILDNKIFRYRAMLYFYYYIKKDTLNYLETNEQDFLKKLFRNTLKKYNISKNDIKKDYLKIEPVLFSKYLDRKISIHNVIKGFKLFIEATGLDVNISTSKNYSQFTINFSQLKIPTGEVFSDISLYELIKLFIHKIETHGYCFNNTLKATGEQITLPSNNIRDEGLAKVNELLLLKGFKNKIKPNHNILRIFMGKELSGKQFFYFLKIFTKLDNNAKSLNKRFLRYKKFHSSDLPGSFSTDIAYDIGTYWARKHIDKLKNEKSIIPYLSLEFLRLGHKNVEISEIYLTNILKKNNIDINNNKNVINFFIKKGFLFRGFNCDYILYNLLHNKYEENHFLKLMKKNYYFLPSDCIKYFTEKIPKAKLDIIVKFLKENSYN